MCVTLWLYCPWRLRGSENGGGVACTPPMLAVAAEDVVYSAVIESSSLAKRVLSSNFQVVRVSIRVICASSTLRMEAD